MIQIKLRELLHERNITQSELSQLTGIRQAAISNLCCQNYTRVSLEHLDKIVTALDISNIAELITVDA